MLKVNTKKISIEEFAKKYKFDSEYPFFGETYPCRNCCNQFIIIYKFGVIEISPNGEYRVEEKLLDLLSTMVLNNDVIKE